jgi:hypothetical protein
LISAVVLTLAACSSAPESKPLVTQKAPPDLAPPVSKEVKAGGEASRRNVKTAIDSDAAKIALEPKDTTIEEIVSQKPPADGKLAGRVAPFETSTWRVKATLKSVKLMKDGDYYLVMKGEKGGETVVEVPGPKDCQGSPLQSKVAEARKALEDRYHPTKDLKEINDSATVTGVGFLGFGQSKDKPGKGHRGPRLMPGLGFQFGDGPNSKPSP